MTTALNKLILDHIAYTIVDEFDTSKPIKVNPNLLKLTTNDGYIMVGMTEHKTHVTYSVSQGVENRYGLEGMIRRSCSFDVRVSELYGHSFYRDKHLTSKLDYFIGFLNDEDGCSTLVTVTGNCDIQETINRKELGERFTLWSEFHGLANIYDLKNVRFVIQLDNDISRFYIVSNGRIMHRSKDFNRNDTEFSDTMNAEFIDYIRSRSLLEFTGVLYNGVKSVHAETKYQTLNNLPNGIYAFGYRDVDNLLLSAKVGNRLSRDNSLRLIFTYKNSGWKPILDGTVASVVEDEVVLVPKDTSTRIKHSTDELERLAVYNALRSIRREFRLRKQRFARNPKH